MSNKPRHTTKVVLVIVAIILLTILSYVVIKFFTDDNFLKDTLNKTPMANIEKEDNSEEKIAQTSQIIEPSKTQESLSSSTDVSQGELKNTNESKSNETVANSSSSTQNSVKKEITKSTSSRSATNRKEEQSSNTQNTKQAQTSTKPQTSSTKTQTNSNSVGTISIPKTGVNLQILPNVSVKGMEYAACFLYSTGALNKSGTTIIVGHNYRNGKLFSNNKKLQIGDTISITTSDGNTVNYTIYDKFITTESDLTYLNKNTTGKAQIALSTCTDDEANRLVILAK